MINHYNPDKHIGNQPVRVLFDGIVSFYSNWTDSFKNDLNDEIKFNGLNRKIMIDIFEGPIKKIAFVDSNKTICIEETFLSFIWIICYAQLVIAEKMNLRSDDIQINPDDMILGDKAFKLFNYGMSLLSNYTKWPEDLPNPEKYKEIDALYIERANRAFIIVTTFILFHEFAHVYLGHIDIDSLKLPVSAEEYKKNELLADKFAIETIMTAINPEDFNDGQACTLMGLSALLLLSGSLEGITHPDPDFRIEEAISHMKLDDNSSMYNIPCISYYLWCFHYKKRLEMPDQFTSTKDRFQKINEQLHTNQPSWNREEFKAYRGFVVTRNNISILVSGKSLTKEGVFLSDNECVNYFDIMQNYLDSVQNRKSIYDKDKLLISEYTEPIDSKEIFYKYISKNTLENYIKKGNFKLGTLNYYQRSENNKIKEEKEGCTHLIIEYKDKQLQLSLCYGFNFLIFCGSSIPPSDVRSKYLRENFGPCVLKIHNTNSFKEEIQKCLNAKASFYNKIEYNEMKVLRYFSEEAYGDISSEIIEPKIFSLATKIVGPSTILRKSFDYLNEYELRFAFEMNKDQDYPVMIQNKGLLDYIEIIEE